MPKGFKCRTVINQGMKPINPVQCGFQKCQNSYSYGPFLRNYYILHFITSGKGAYINQNGSYRLTEGQMFIIRPGENTYYEADTVDPWSYYWIGFTSEIELPTALATNDVIDAPFAEKYFRDAFHTEEFDAEDLSGAYEYYLCGIIWQILGVLKRNEAAKQHSDDYLKIAVSLMRSEGRMKISNISKFVHISPMHLTRLFNQKYGMSPGKLYMRIRMERAAELLSAGHHLSKVANTVGYPDAFSFSRAFKKHYGCSPTEYIKLQKGERIR